MRGIVSPSPVYLREVPFYCLKALSIQIGLQGECPHLRAVWWLRRRDQDTHGCTFFFCSVQFVLLKLLQGSSFLSPILLHSPSGCYNCDLHVLNQGHLSPKLRKVLLPGPSFAMSCCRCNGCHVFARLAITI